MIRYALFAMMILGTAAAATAAVQPAATGVDTANQTVITKNSPFPVMGPITVEECTADDCSDLNG